MPRPSNRFILLRELEMLCRDIDRKLAAKVRELQDIQNLLVRLTYSEGAD